MELKLRKGREDDLLEIMRLNGELADLNEEYTVPGSKDEIKVVVERFKLRKDELRDRLADSIEVTFKEGENRLVIIDADTGEEKVFSGVSILRREPLCINATRLHLSASSR